MATALRLHTREARRKLAARDQAYYVELRRGLALGYRRGSEGGSWLLREYRAGRYVKRRLGAADDELPADGVSVLSWEEAQCRALALDRPTVSKPGKHTLAQAAEAYFDTRSAITPHDRFTWMTFIEPKLGDRPIAELTTGEIEAWLAAQVPTTDDREARRAAQATANRRFTVLRAILNSAYRKDPARVPSADAWRRVRPFQKVDRPRTRTLTAVEARALLKVLPPDLGCLARASLYTGLRLGEVLALTTTDLANNAVRVEHSKSGRPRSVPLTSEGATFFEQCAKGKNDGDRLFKPISPVSVSRGMRAACQAAEVHPPATFHDLRRSYGSLLLNSGASADVISELLGHADMRMTRRAYAHLLDRTLRRAVIQHLPTFKVSTRKRQKLTPQ
jgi:integrase